MTLSGGMQLGPYQILSPVGAGGMGEVYLARDGKLDRQVAIKVLPEPMTRDPERVARFEREVKLLASIDQPNIATIYGFEDAGPSDEWAEIHVTRNSHEEFDRLAPANQ